MSNYLPVGVVHRNVMSTSQSPQSDIGIDHLTVTPANYSQDTTDTDNETTEDTNTTNTEP